MSGTGGKGATMSKAGLAAAGPPVPIRRRSRGRNHWIVLDSAWAARLGVRKEGGAYRIRSRELLSILTSAQARSASPRRPRADAA